MIIKRIGTVLGALATALTLLMFFTGLNLPEILATIQSKINAMIESKPHHVSPPTQVALVLWAIVTTLASFISSDKTDRRRFLPEFLKNFGAIGALLFIVGLIWSFRIGDEFRLMLIFVILDVLMVGSIIRAVASIVNRLGHWPRDFATNAIIIGVLAGTPIIPVNVQLGMSLIIISLLLGMITARKKDRESRVSSENDPRSK